MSIAAIMLALPDFFSRPLGPSLNVVIARRAVRGRMRPRRTSSKDRTSPSENEMGQLQKAYTGRYAFKGIRGRKQSEEKGSRPKADMDQSGQSLVVLEASTSSMPSSLHNWNKIDSLTPELKRRAQKKWSTSVKVEQYRMEPPPGMAFGAIGSYHWPAEEFPPYELLGRSHEALDPIRISCECFVMYDRGKKVFRVMGTIENVQRALQLIRNTFLQLAARTIINTRLYLLHWPDASALPSHVKLLQHIPPASREKPLGTEVWQSPCATGIETAGSNEYPGEYQTALSYDFLRRAVLRMLQRLHYHRGAISMRLTLGTLVVDQFRRLPEGRDLELGYKLDEYLDMIKQSQFKARVTEAILLTSIHEVKPLYSAAFTFADPLGDFNYAIDWKDTGVETKIPEYRAEPRGWTRLEAFAKEPRALLDITLTNLSVGSCTDTETAHTAAIDNPNAASSWRFGIDTNSPVPAASLPPHLMKFAEGVNCDIRTATINPNDDFVVCAKLPSLMRIRQCISYSYRIVDSDYTLKLMSFQDRIKDRDTQKMDTYEPRWNLEICRPEWEAMFKENERLEAGQSTSWADDTEAWFPCDIGSHTPDKDDGFAQLMVKLQRVETVVRSSWSSRASSGENSEGT
nr:hypothetical protein CFP56_62475 [Quercus suber]